MKLNNGFTLVEMLISMIVAAILMLAVGSISSISLRAHKKTRDKAEIFSELSYGLKFMKQRTRGADSLSIKSPSGVWLSNRLIAHTGDAALPNHAFGLYQASGSTRTEFIYLDDENDSVIEVNKEVIFFVDASDTLNLALSFSGTLNNIVTGTLSGTKQNIPFSMATTIKKRVETP